MNNRTIIYISGEGHSGTTLLDVILGAKKSAFSSGELIFFAQKGIKNREYCACGNPVPSCSIWSNIIREWDKVRTLDLDEYIKLQSRLTSKRYILSSYISLRNPSKKLHCFLEDTNKLFDLIFKITDSKVIIDSSKAPGRLLVLKKLNYKIKVMHLTRRFGDVLNSYKKEVPRNLEEGIEHDIVPLGSSYVFRSWLLKNFLTYVLSIGISYKRIKYENLVSNPVDELSFMIDGDKDFLKKLTARGPFYLKHLVAGNKFRMQDHIYIAEKPMNTSYHRLSGADKAFAKFIDYFY